MTNCGVDTISRGDCAARGTARVGSLISLRWLGALLAFVALAWPLALSWAEDRAAQPKDGSPSSEAAPKRKYETLTLRGRVVIESEALRRLFDIKIEETDDQRQVVLETRDGELHPIIRDVRGRAFLKDDRLREMELELLVRRYEGSPLIQIVRVYSLERGQKLEVDYWCDVCAIPMFELKACECCQGETRLRKSPVRAGESR